MKNTLLFCCGLLFLTLPSMVQAQNCNTYQLRCESDAYHSCVSSANRRISSAQSRLNSLRSESESVGFLPSEIDALIDGFESTLESFRQTEQRKKSERVALVTRLSDAKSELARLERIFKQANATKVLLNDFRNEFEGYLVDVVAALQRDADGVFSEGSGSYAGTLSSLRALRTQLINQNSRATSQETKDVLSVVVSVIQELIDQEVAVTTSLGRSRNGLSPSNTDLKKLTTVARVVLEAGAKQTDVSSINLHDKLALAIASSSDTVVQIELRIAELKDSIEEIRDTLLPNMDTALRQNRSYILSSEASLKEAVARKNALPGLISSASSSLESERSSLKQCCQYCSYRNRPSGGGSDF
jgi:hypothetical protein